MFLPAACAPTLPRPAGIDLDRDADGGQILRDRLRRRQLVFIVRAGEGEAEVALSCLGQ